MCQTAQVEACRCFIGNGTWKMEFDISATLCAYKTLEKIPVSSLWRLMLSASPIVWGLPWRGSVMPKPRHTKENGAVAPNLDMLPDVEVKKNTSVVPTFIGWVLKWIGCHAFHSTLRQIETGRRGNKRSNNFQRGQMLMAMVKLLRWTAKS